MGEPEKRPSATDEKPKKRRKKNPYGGDKLMQIAANYSSGTFSVSPRPEVEKTPVAEENKAVPRARGGFSALAAKHEDTLASEPDVSEIESTNDGMVGDEKFFPSRRLLPVWKARHNILAALERNNVLILTGEAGSGKSTQVPQVLCSAPWCSKMVGVTQPRRIAATSLAYRVAAEMGTPLDKNAGSGSVGYSVRFDTRVPKGTQIKYLTEGRLLQEFLMDQSLSQYSAIIVDEVHERSINVDLVMGFLRLILDANRARATQGANGTSDRSASSSVKRPSGEPLKVVLMSATANVEKLQKLFASEMEDPAPRIPDAGQTIAKAEVGPAENALDDVKVIRVSGRQYPIDIIHERNPVPSYVGATIETVMKINTTEQFPGDILAFLPGQDQIYEAVRIISSKAADLPSNVPRLEPLPLFSQLPKKEQDKALGPVRQSFTRKVILATNIAETSVTVSGVRYVVDSGMAKIKEFDVQHKRELLGNLPISKSSAIQRAGRAGREGPGKCFRMYTQQSFDSLPTSDTPEILRVDVADAVLTMLASGVTDPFTFPLVSKPSRTAMKEGILQLYGLGAVNDKMKVTDDGISISKMPLPVAYGRVLLEAARAGCLLQAIDIVACLTMNGVVFLERNNHEPSGTGAKSTNKSKDEKGSREDSQKNGLVDKQKGGEDDKDGEDGEDSEDDSGGTLVSRNIKELRCDDSDLLTYYTTLNKMLEQRDRKWSAWCRDRMIHEGNMRQALRIRRQLRKMCVGLGFLDNDVAAKKWEQPEFVPMSKEAEEQLIKCFLRAFAFNSAELKADGNYETRTKETVYIHPSSVLSERQSQRRGPPAILFIEQVYTRRNYARIVSAVDPGWIKPARDHWE